MNRKITIEERDDMPGKQNAAQMGRGGDTELAHVNPWEKMLLKLAGGSGTTNPRTGLKEFANYGDNDELNKLLAGLTGYTGDFGGGQYQSWLNSALPNPTANFGANPELNKALAVQSGYTGDFGGGGYQDYISKKKNPQSNAGGFFNFPLDIMPSSKSTSSSSSGLPGGYQEKLLSVLMPQIQSAIANMPGNIDTYTNEAMGGYKQLLDNSLNKAIPAAIGNLANRGILSSTEGNKILADVINAAREDATNKQFEISKQGALLKAGMPATLAGMADLGKSQTSTSASFQSDPTTMYRTMADLIRNMM